MNRGNSMRQPNGVANVSRNHTQGASNLPEKPHHPKNKGGLPYIPSTPSTRSSTSYGSQCSNSFEDNSTAYGAEPYGYDVKQSWKDGETDNINNRGRFESPSKRHDRTGYQRNSPKKATDSYAISVPEHSSDSKGEYHLHQPKTPVFYVQPISGYRQCANASNPSSSSPKVTSSDASQSTSSTSSSRRQLIPHMKSSSSTTSTLGSASANENYRKTSRQHHPRPDSVREDPYDNEDEISLEVDEVDTVHTRPMIRYKSATKRPPRETTDGLLPSSRSPEPEDEGVDESAFFNESFDTVDFGSTTGMAPTTAVPMMPLAVPKRLLGVNPPHVQQYQPRHGYGYDDEPERYYDYEDDGAYCEDQELLYENSNDEYEPPEYEEEGYYDEAEVDYDDEVQVKTTEEEQLRRAVRRGSALAYSNREYSTEDSKNYNRHDAELNKPNRPISSRSEAMKSNTQRQIPQRQPSQTATGAARRPQISRSMASKRHLIAASARGVVPTRVTSNNALMDMEIQPIFSKQQRGAENEIQQQQQQQQQQKRQIVLKASSYGDIEKPPIQQSRRGSVTKAASHSNSMPNPPPRTRPHPSRKPSFRGFGDLPMSELPHSPPHRPSMRRTASSRRHNNVNEEATLRRQENQRGSVAKAVSYSTMESQNPTETIRNAVNKSASHNGTFESSPNVQSIVYISPAHARGINESSGRSGIDPLETRRAAVPSTNNVQHRNVPSSSSRRRSLEHVPSQSFRVNAEDARYQDASQRQYQSSPQTNHGSDYHYEDNNQYLGVREGKLPNLNISHRRMSSGYLPPQQQSTQQRAAPRRNKSMDLTFNDIVHNNDENDNVNDVSFTDLAARRF